MSATDFADPHQIIHVPARDLTGTREAKLADLDMFLAQLQMVRLVLDGQTSRPDDHSRGAGQPRTGREAASSRPATRWRTILGALATNVGRSKHDQL